MYIYLYPVGHFEIVVELQIRSSVVELYLVIALTIMLVVISSQTFSLFTMPLRCLGSVCCKWRIRAAVPLSGVHLNWTMWEY
jgi:hypothetical protein